LTLGNRTIGCSSIFSTSLIWSGCAKLSPMHVYVANGSLPKPLCPT
jgi:hypothetical protein